MPILLNVLTNSDQKVVEQGSICVSRVVESFKYQHEKLEELVSADLLKAIRRLLQPGTTNLIGPNIHTQFLRVLSITARASPTLASELFKMDIVDTLYQILTGVSPPSGLEDVASEIDSVFIMQALIHRPREQISETLNVICELLPAVQSEHLSVTTESQDGEFFMDQTISHIDSDLMTSQNTERLRLLGGCEDEIKRFGFILIPTLTDAYSSTVNLGVRQKVLLAQLKMLSNLDASILQDALRTVPFASYLTSILSQEDHPSLITLALKAADLLLNRLPSIYGYQFYREGVMAEISKLAAKPVTKVEGKMKSIKIEPGLHAPKTISATVPDISGISGGKGSAEDPTDDDSDQDDGREDDDDDDDDDGADEDRGGAHEIHEEVSLSPSDSSSSSQDRPLPSLVTDNDLNTHRAKKFLEVHETAKAQAVRDRATAILLELQSLASNIEKCYLTGANGNEVELFTQLSKHFQGDALETVTSSELLYSGVVRVLLEIFSTSEGKQSCEPSKFLLTSITDQVSSQARSAFLEVFMTSPNHVSPSQTQPPTPFSVFVHKLQDLLSREEHFEVVTIHHNALDNNRSSPAAMLSKQLRLKLVAEDDAEMPRPYRNLMISIHAIANFKALDDYLRPRISLSERPRGARHRDGVSNALATFAAAAGMPHAHQKFLEREAAAIENENENMSTPSTPADDAGPDRAPRKVLKTRSSESKAGSNSTRENLASARRIHRPHQPASDSPPDVPAPPTDRVQSPLECADERQLSDEDDADDTSALDAIVDDLDDSMDGDQLPEPTAVNMEIASTGGVTARKEDGTRVATPSQTVSSSQGPPALRSRESMTAGVNQPSTGRAMSYAAAVQAVPQDWHIEFSIDDQRIPSETTIYSAVHRNKSEILDSSIRNIWSAIHTIKFKRVPGPPPSELSTVKPLSKVSRVPVPHGLPISLHAHPTTSTSLRLLNILHEMNANLDDVLDDSKKSIHVKAEPVAQFVNTKLTAKLNRQLEEPLIVASECLPEWSEDLARLYPFLFPFETRHLFLQSTAFGYARCMTKWQNQSVEESRRDRHRDDRPFMGRLQRQKVRISRTRMLESAMKVMELYGQSKSVLEVEYFEEVGTGLGPTLEFYSTVSREFSKKKTGLWRENDSNESEEYAFGKLGMFPAPMDSQMAVTENGKKILAMFKMLGKFIARSMVDSRIIDVSINPTFFRIGDEPSTIPLSLGAVKTVDSHLATSLKLLKQYAAAKHDIEKKPHASVSQKAQLMRKVVINGARIEDLGLDFTLPGYPTIELIPNGASKNVTLDNVSLYVDKVVDMTLGSGVQRQVDHFRTGFSEVFSYSALKAFTPSELVMLFGRVEEDWSIESELTST